MPYGDHMNGERIKVHRVNVGPGRRAGDVVWGIHGTETGAPLGQRRRLVLTDVTFEVDREGRARARQTGRFTVHAVIEGTVDAGNAAQILGDWRQVFYYPNSPFDTFYAAGTCEPVLSAPVARLDPDGSVWIPV